jgi:SAM-dependent methyltransferase
MDEEILVELPTIVKRHPWWRARALLTLDLLVRLGIRGSSRLLDAGCGWGVTLETFEQSGYHVVGADISRRCLEQLDRPGRDLVEVDLTQSLPAGVESFDAVLALDVIEHLDDDHSAVKRLGSLVRPGGYLVVSVPALPELFTEFDAIQGHRRRYLPETLSAVFDDTGLKIEQIFWWGQWLVPMLRRQRRNAQSRAGESVAQTYRRYLNLPPWPLPWMLRLAFAWEKNRALCRKLQTGTSLFAVAQRP